MASDDPYSDNRLLTVVPLVIDAGFAGRHSWRLTLHSLETWTQTTAVHYSLKFAFGHPTGLAVPKVTALAVPEWRAFLEVDLPHVLVTLLDTSGAALPLLTSDLGDLEYSWIGRAEFAHQAPRLPVQTLVLKLEGAEARIDLPLS
jgi:hypothetical protein